MDLLSSFGNTLNPKQEIYEITQMRKKQTHNEQTQKPVNDTAIVLDREADYSQAILSRAAIKMNRAACLEKKKILSHALEQKSHSSYISFLQDLTKNKCSQFIKQNTNALLKTTLNEQNLVEILDDYVDLLDIARGISDLELSKSAIDDLEREKSEELKKSIFLALNRHIEDSTTMIEVAISLATIQKLAQKNFKRICRKGSCFS